MHTVLYPRKNKPMTLTRSASTRPSSSRDLLSRRAVLKAAALAPLMGPAAAVVAQPAAYPSHALKMVIPFPAGGATDYAGRAIVITTLVLTLGFLPMAASDYFPISMYGTFLPMTLVLALGADLFLVPAMCHLGWIRFSTKARST